MILKIISINTTVMQMRIELDKPLTKTKLRQVLKLIGNDVKHIKVIMGTEIFEIDTIVTKNDTMYLCTDSKETSKFFAEKVTKNVEKVVKDVEKLDLDEEDDNILNDDYQDPRVKHYPVYYTVTHDNEWERKWEEYRKKHGLPKYYVGDTPGFGDDITCKNQE